MAKPVFRSDKFALCFKLLFSSSILLGQNSFYAKEHALEELKIIKHAIVDYHPSPFRYISHDSWNNYYDEIENVIQEKDSINMFDFFSLASPLVSLLRDEHSNLFPKDSELKAWSLTRKFFPFEVSIATDSSLLIERAIDPSLDPIYVGKKVVSINGRTVKEIIDVLRLCGGTSASSDYSGTLYHAFNFDNFSRLYYLCIDQSETFEVRFKSGEKHLFQGHSASEGSLSIYKLNPETPPEFYISDDSSSAYLRISTFWPPAAKTTIGRAQKEIDKYFKQLKAHRTKRIVIDVRGNRGGTPFYATYLAGYFSPQPFGPMNQITAKTQAVEDFPKRFKGIRKPVFDSQSQLVVLPKLMKAFNSKHPPDLIFNGEVIVLIDAGTGSAASIFAGLMSELEHVQFFGHETLGDANQTTGGQFKDFELPHSNLVLTIPLLLFRHGSNEHAYGVKPNSQSIDQSLVLSERQLNLSNR